MGIIFLMGLLFGAVAFARYYYVYEKKDEKSDKVKKWIVGLIFFVIGIIVGVIVSGAVGENIVKKYLANQAPVTVLGNINLFPFSGSFGTYIVIGKNQYGKKVVWYLRGEEELCEERYPYDDTIDRSMIVFSNAKEPAKQLVKVNVGSFWKWFAIIRYKYRFFIPVGGLQEGKIIKTYKYIPE